MLHARIEQPSSTLQTSLIPQKTRHLLCSRISILRRHRGRQTTHNQHDDQERAANDDELAHSRVTHTVVCPGALTLCDVALDLLAAELVVDEAAEGDGVAEGLEAGDGVMEEDHAGDDEEDVLEDAGQGEDERGGFANLIFVC